MPNWENTRIPRLRFPEFEGDWEEKRLGEIVKFKTSNSFSRDNLNYEKGRVKNIHYGDIHTKFQTLFDIENEKVPYVNESIPLQRISEENFCQEGDIIFADASEDLNDIGKSIEIVNLNNEKLISGLHTLLARPERNIFHKGFAGYVLKSPNIRKQISKESQGAKVLGITAGRLSKVNINIPNLDEQRKIAELFSLLDQKIISLKKTIRHFETLMKSLHQKIILRQSKNTKIRDCVTCYSSTLKESDVNETSGEYPVYGAVGIVGSNSQFLVEPDAILIIKDGASVGKVQFVNGKFSITGTLNYFLAKNDTNLKYLYYCLKYFNFDVYKVGSGIPHIYFRDYGDALIHLPNREQQNKIAHIFSKIDEKIETEKQILKLLELQKKHLLKNLFV